MKILYRGIFIATFKRTYIQDQARPIIVTSLLSYETSPYFSWREKSLLPKFLSQLEPCILETEIVTPTNETVGALSWKKALMSAVQNFLKYIREVKQESQLVWNHFQEKIKFVTFCYLCPWPLKKKALWSVHLFHFDFNLMTLIYY